MMKKKILIAEDQPEMRSNLVKLLELNNYDTYAANNGIIALQMALNYLPDLIISDIMMPELDGFELLLELQKYQEAATIPVLFLTAKTEHKDYRQGMRLGASDYITKPFSFNELLSAVETQLVKKKKTEELFERKFEKLRSSLRRSLPHEIRTPLNAILGYSSVMANNFDTITKDEFKEMMNGINSSAKRLHELLEKFLLYAKLELIDSNPEEKKLLAKKMTHSAKILIHEIAEYKARSYNRVSDITKKITDTTINISEEYLIRIIEELVDNAMKFSNPGTPVEISTFKTVIDYFITIKDFGRGFSPEQVNEIGAYLQFDRKFYEQQGSGLGLTIVKKIIDLHYGTFKIESDLGKGTRITISLPLEQS